MRHAFLIPAFLFSLAALPAALPAQEPELSKADRCVWAVSRGDVDALAALLEEDAGLANAVDREGRPVLFLATLYPNGTRPEVVNLLLLSGADPNGAWEEIGWAPIHSAAEHASTGVVRALLERGADPNAVMGSDRETALRIAARADRTDNVLALLEGGAELDQRASNGGTALHAALIKERWSMAELLIRRGAALDLVDDDWGAPLALAALRGNAELVETLLAAGASVNPPFPRRGPTPLLAAARSSRLPLVHLLLEHGAGVDAVGLDNYSQSALHHASRAADLALIEVLLEAGADVNVIDTEGKTPLAVTEDEAARALLERHGGRPRRPAAELGTVRLDVRRLTSWGARRYRLTHLPRYGSGQKEPIPLGTITLATEVVGDELVFRDSYDLIFGRQSIRGVITSHCRSDSFLGLLRVDAVGESSDEFGTFTARRDGARLLISGEGEPTSLDLSPGTVSLEAFFRLVTLMPRDPGTTYAVPHLLETPELNLKDDYALTCLGPDSLLVGERRIPCTRFALDGPYDRVFELWVDGDGVLRRFLIDGEELAELED